MKIKQITTIIILLIITTYVTNAQDNVFNGTSSTDWDNAANWSTGKVPPTEIVQKITISADCEVNNSTDYTFYEGSIFRIASGVTFTNNGTGTWTMEGLIDNEGIYVGDLVITGNIEPGDNTYTWTCGDDLIYGGQTYATLQIGTQCWMVENLNIGTICTTAQSTDNNIIEKFCYDEILWACNNDGGLYQWNEMMQYVTTVPNQGICPTGWHLPSDEEYKTLEMELGMDQNTANMTGWRGDISGKLKDVGSSWYPPNSCATNSSGFTAISTGSYFQLGYYFRGLNTTFWSSTEIGENSWRRLLSYSSCKVNRTNSDKTNGFNVRCVRD